MLSKWTQHKGLYFSSASVLHLHFSWCGKRKPAGLPTILLLLVMVWFPFPHLERIKCYTYFPTSPSNYHFPQKYHAVEQFIILWCKTDVYLKPANTGSWLGSLNAYLSVWTIGVNIFETPNQIAETFFLSNRVSAIHLCTHTRELKGFHIRFQYSTKCFIFGKIVERKLLREKIMRRTGTQQCCSHKFLVLFGLKLFSMLYIVTRLDFRCRNNFRFRDNHSQTGVSLKPSHSVFGVISVYCFSITWYLANVGKKALLWADSIIKALNFMSRHWRDKERAIGSKKKLQMQENF